MTFWSSSETSSFALRSLRLSGLCGFSFWPSPRAASPSSPCSCLRSRSKHALSFSLVKGRVPEMQVQDFALARKEVVLDVEPVHGLEMTAQDRGGDQVGDRSDLVAALFDRVQRLQANLQVLLVLRRTTARPARRGPSSSSRNAAARRVASISARDFFSRCTKSDDHVGHLHAGVVDVVLDVDFAARQSAAGARTCRRGSRCAGARCAPPCWD